MMDLYAEEIISHYEHPHNKGRIENPSAKMHEHNALCGDDITIYLKIKNDVVEDAKFDGMGCAIDTASASMLTDYIKGRRVEEVEKIGLEDLLRIIGIDPGPARMHCATLPLKAVKEALFMYKNKTARPKA